MKKTLTSGAGLKPSGYGVPFLSLENAKSNQNGAASVPRPNPRRTHMMRLRSSGDGDSAAQPGPVLVSCQNTKVPLYVDLTSSPETLINSLQNPAETLPHNVHNLDNSVHTGMRRDEEIENVDVHDEEDYNCAVYVNDILPYLFSLEKKYPIMPNCLSGKKINSKHRAIMMDWLVQFHFDQNMYTETLFLCQKILDRVLIADDTISRENLQLVGVTSLFLAAKYEEPGPNPPKLSIFVEACVKENIQGNDIRAMELKILQTLDYDLGCPPSILFLRRFSKVAKTQNRYGNYEVHTLAKYLMELTIIDYLVIDMMPSAIAAGSLALAIMIWKQKSLRVVWTPTLEHYSTYTFNDVRLHTLRIAHVLARVQEGPNRLNLKGVKDKKYGKVGEPFHAISKSEELYVDKWKSRIMSELEPLEEN